MALETFHRTLRHNTMLAQARCAVCSSQLLRAARSSGVVPRLVSTARAHTLAESRRPGLLHATRRVAPMVLRRYATTLESKPEHPDDERVLQGDPPNIILTERAVKVRPFGLSEIGETDLPQKLQMATEQENNPNTALRVSVEPGGCHGYQYKMEITQEKDEDDLYVARLQDHAGLTDAVCFSRTVYASTLTVSRWSCSRGARSTM